MKMFDKAETVILMNSAKKQALALSAAQSLKRAKQSARVRGYAKPQQARQFDHIAKKHNQKLMKKIYLLGLAAQ